MVEIKSAGEVDAMYAAGQVVGTALREIEAAADVGVRLSVLDQLARSVLSDAAASSPFLGYQPGFASTPFPAVICASVNDAVLHGIPDRYRLRDGDLVSIDFGAVLDGWAADAATSFVVGAATAEDLALVEVTQAALTAGITAARAGSSVGDISYAVGLVGRAAGYGISLGFGGHGVGRQMHEEPSVPNEGRPGRGLRLRPGLVLAIEPWFMAGGSDDYRIDADGWTLRSADGSRGAHCEHTVAITDGDARVLTALPAG